MKGADSIIVDLVKKKLSMTGVESLSELELLIMILKTGDELKDVRTLAEHLLRRYSNLNEIANLSIEKLADENKGLTYSKALNLKCSLELGRRSLSAPLEQAVIHSSKDIAKIVSPMLKTKDKEYFMVAVLNTKNMLIALEVVTIGTLNQSCAHAREVFKLAISKSAYGIILIHNHPSTDVTPSAEDHEVTKMICQSGEIIGIKLIDHIIIGGNKYFSFADEGLMNNCRNSLLLSKYDKLTQKII